MPGMEDYLNEINKAIKFEEDDVLFKMGDIAHKALEGVDISQEEINQAHEDIERANDRIAHYERAKKMIKGENQ